MQACPQDTCQSTRPVKACLRLGGGRKWHDTLWQAEREGSAYRPAGSVAQQLHSNEHKLCAIAGGILVVQAEKPLLADAQAVQLHLHSICQVACNAARDEAVQALVQSS